MRCRWRGRFRRCWRRGSWGGRGGMGGGRFGGRARVAGEIPALLEAGIMVETGGHGLLTFRRSDLIVVSPGVPMDTPEVKQVMSFGLPVIGELERGSRDTR